MIDSLTRGFMLSRVNKLSALAITTRYWLVTSTVACKPYLQITDNLPISISGGRQETIKHKIYVNLDRERWLEKKGFGNG